MAPFFSQGENEDSHVCPIDGGQGRRHPVNHPPSAAGHSVPPAGRPPAVAAPAPVGVARLDYGGRRAAAARRAASPASAASGGEVGEAAGIL